MELLEHLMSPQKEFFILQLKYVNAGWWPSRADTYEVGCKKGHLRFPGGKETQGYAYMLTHLQTPSVYDHMFSRYKPEISALISLRNRNKIVYIMQEYNKYHKLVMSNGVFLWIGPLLTPKRIPEIIISSSGQ
ncbi:hypothetical protein Tco_0782298 [Tanacetum coccineum]